VKSVKNDSTLLPSSTVAVRNAMLRPQCDSSHAPAGTMKDENLVASGGLRAVQEVNMMAPAGNEVDSIVVPRA